MKQAFVVCGAESSGNRLLTAVLVRSGCVGSATDDGGIWSRIEPGVEPRIVLTLSYPNGHVWPELPSLHWRLNNKGYLVWYLVTVRDHTCVLASQKKSRLKPEPLAWGNYQRAYREIFSQLATIDASYIIVPYEALVARTQYVDRLLTQLELPGVHGPVIVNGVEKRIRDENRKWYVEEES